MKFTIITFTLLALLNLSVCYNILVAVHFPSRSHFLSFSKLFEGLARKGHNVTVISYYPEKNPIPNYRDVDIGNLDIMMKQLSPFTDFKNIKSDKLSMYRFVVDLGESGNSACEMALESKAVKEFLKEENSFDLLLVEDFFSECMCSLVQKYDCPVIRFISHSLLPWNGKQVGNPLASAYAPNVYQPRSNKMSFIERLENTLVNLFDILYFEFSVVPIQEEITKKYVNVDETTFSSEHFNTSLILLNTHFVLNPPRPLVPNMIEVGGIHIGEARQLEKGLEKWINDSKDGVIYFCLGSVVKGQSMPEEKRKAFINAFKRLPQRVIWKWESDEMEGKPDNIMVGKWLPQFDILSHPNVKAFISHGGLMGAMEAVHCGVPMMVMPQFGDQHSNAKALESIGGGVVLYMNDANEETIYQNLKKILEPSFQAQAKQLSERFRDRPMPPLETAIYWVEYVIRHKGAHFMKTAAVNMPFYQYYLLDVIAFIVTVLLMLFSGIYLFLRFVLKKCGILSRKTVKHKKA